MAFVYCNPNPELKDTVDCTVRAVSVLLGQSWDNTYMDLSAVGFYLCEPFVVDNVWWAYLKRKGYIREFVPNTCPDCYTVIQFCRDHPYGRYLLKTSKHVVGVIDGDYYDTFNSGNDTITYFVTKGANINERIQQYGSTVQ